MNNSLLRNSMLLPVIVDPLGGQATADYNLDMSPDAAELLEKALDLDEKERASLAGALLESLEPPDNDNDVEAAWDLVIKRRIEELESGTVQGVPWSEVKKQLFSGFE